MSELQDGLVQYVRMNHSSHSNPLHDSFDLFVSDGRHNSTVGKVEIAFDRSSASWLDFRLDPIQVSLTAKLQYSFLQKLCPFTRYR